MADRPRIEVRRRYVLQRRRAQVEGTRQRITAAAFELHATIGPSRTTISAIAERAGVQRHTVYRHFPDLDDLYEACTTHGLRVTGVPLPASWMAIADPAERLRRGLTELFAWYRANERMLTTILGDAAAAGPAAEGAEQDQFDQHMGEVFNALANDGWHVAPEARPPLEAVIGHAMEFQTWRSLTRFGLGDDQARDLLVNVAVSIAEGALAATAPSLPG